MKAHAKFLSILILAGVLVPPTVRAGRPDITALPETTWTTQSSGTSTSLYAIHAVSQNVAWAGGGTGTGTSGIVIRTTDGGTTWSNAGTFAADIFSLSAVDGSTCIATSWTATHARLIKTTNGGATWRTVDSVASGFYDNVTMFNANSGYAIGDPVAGNWVLKRTNDGGNTWVHAATLPQTSGTEAGWNGWAWYDSTYGWFGSNSNRVYRTTNGGSSWQSTVTSLVGANSLYFTTPLLGLTGSPPYRTTDGGVSWSFLTGAPIGSVTGVRGTQEFWKTSGAGMAYTSNAGDSWTTSGPHVYTGPCQIGVGSTVTEGTNVFGWWLGLSGCLAHYSRITTGVPVGGTDLPSSFNLEQNYPNPFNPVTTIRYSLTPSLSQSERVSEGRVRVTLEVYDILGREVATLIDEVKPPGEYSINFDVGNLPSGVYFYMLRSGPFTDSRKMLLIR